MIFLVWEPGAARQGPLEEGFILGPPTGAQGSGLNFRVRQPVG